MTISICPDCHDGLIDESDLCSMCSETFASSCDCLRYEQCDDCAAGEDFFDDDASPRKDEAADA